MEAITTTTIQDLTNATVETVTEWATTELFSSTAQTENHSLPDEVNITAISRARDTASVSKYYPIIVAVMVLSCLCLIFSIIVYSILPEFRNVHGKNLISMSSCLLITFIMLILDLIIRNHIPFSACFTIAMVIHMTFLATFFWTNIMAYDIWRSLTSIKSKEEGHKRYSKKFTKYSIYAWIATMLTALPAAVLELTNWVPMKYRPQFGVSRCWLSGRTAFYFYFNLPVGAILFCNLVLFLLTIRKLRIIKKMTAILNVKQQQKRLNLYLKLFLVMGITWSTEFIPWITGIYGLYALAGMLTGLHGLFLFVIFVAKKRILRQFFLTIRQGKSVDGPPATSTQQTPVSLDNRKKSFENLGDSKF